VDILLTGASFAGRRARVSFEDKAMYAVIRTGGKQYRVQEGDTIYVEKLEEPLDADLRFDVLLLGKEDGVTAGRPVVDGAAVTAKVAGQVKGEKLIVYKYKAKKNYRRKQGHRQPYTKLTITGIEA
jgi:large subunit ribosomal protein L21